MQLGLFEVWAVNSTTRTSRIYFIRLRQSTSIILCNSQPQLSVDIFGGVFLSSIPILLIYRCILVLLIGYLL